MQCPAPVFLSLCDAVEAACCCCPSSCAASHPVCLCSPCPMSQRTAQANEGVLAEVHHIQSQPSPLVAAQARRAERAADSEKFEKLIENLNVSDAAGLVWWSVRGPRGHGATCLPRLPGTCSVPLHAAPPPSCQPHLCACNLLHLQAPTLGGTEDRSRGMHIASLPILWSIERMRPTALPAAP